MNKMNIRETGLYVIGSIVFAMFLWTLVMLFAKEIPLANKDVLLILVGVIASKTGTVIDYFFGSSKGSADKSETLAATQATAPDAAPKAE